MSEIEDIRRRKLAQLQANQNAQANSKIKEEAELQRQIAELEGIVKQLFTKEALERYGNIKAVDQEKAIQVIAVIGQLVQSGRVQKINDEMLKNLLMRLAGKKRESKIRRA